MTSRDIVQPEMSLQNHPIKKEPVAVGSSAVDVRKRNSEEWSSKPASAGPDLVPHPRKKPKLEKFVVSDLMKSPRKKSMEQEQQEWRERKKAKRKSSEGGSSVQETKRTWKVVSSFDWDNESTSSDNTHQKKLDVVLTQSHIKKGIKSEEGQKKTKLGKSDKKIEIDEIGAGADEEEG